MSATIQASANAGPICMAEIVVSASLAFGISQTVYDASAMDMQTLVICSVVLVLTVVTTPMELIVTGEN